MTGRVLLASVTAAVAGLGAALVVALVVLVVADSGPGRPSPDGPGGFDPGWGVGAAALVAAGVWAWSLTRAARRLDLRPRRTVSLSAGFVLLVWVVLGVLGAAVDARRGAADVLLLAGLAALLAGPVVAVRAVGSGGR